MAFRRSLCVVCDGRIGCCDVCSACFGSDGGQACGARQSQKLWYCQGEGQVLLVQSGVPFRCRCVWVTIRCASGNCFDRFHDDEGQRDVSQLFPTDQIPWYYIAINLAAAPFINFLPALGEEYGWRGFLLPKLIAKYNLIIGLLLTGTIWGLWHAPVILMGYNYPHHPDLLGVTAFTVWCILAGFFLGWLRLKSESVFPAALGHGAINAFIGFGMFIAPASDELMTTPFGFPGILPLLLLAVMAYLDLTAARTTSSLAEIQRG